MDWKEKRKKEEEKVNKERQQGRKKQHLQTERVKRKGKSHQSQVGVVGMMVERMEGNWREEEEGEYGTVTVSDHAPSELFLPIPIEQQDCHYCWGHR